MKMHNYVSGWCHNNNNGNLLGKRGAHELPMKTFATLDELFWYKRGVRHIYIYLAMPRGKPLVENDLIKYVEPHLITPSITIYSSVREMWVALSVHCGLCRVYIICTQFGFRLFRLYDVYI